MQNTNVKILAIDEVNELPSAQLNKIRGYPASLDIAKSVDLAWDYLQYNDYDLILCGFSNSPIACINFLKKVKRLSLRIPVVISTSNDDISLGVEAIKFGASEVIEKPLVDKQVYSILDKASKFRELRHYKIQNKDLPEIVIPCFDKMVGKSKAMRSIFSLITDVAETDANIFISGESGTGKELVARSIHKQSLRKNQAFVPVNCSALPEQLFESELFGYEKGAFTGATQQKLGLLEFAHKGSFFMDEVCQLPIYLQPKLLRVLQEKQLRHLCSSELVDIDIRFISASNIDPDKALETNALRRDFYYRINVINIHLPPLRDRQEDVKLLAYSFLDCCLKSTTKEIFGFDNDVMACLESYSWPGNVRELENVVERAVALTREDIISLDDIPVQIRKSTKSKSVESKNLSLVDAKKEAIEKIEKEYLLRLLTQHHGNVTNIAKESGMTRRNLHRLLNRYQFNPVVWRN